MAYCTAADIRKVLDPHSANPEVPSSDLVSAASLLDVRLLEAADQASVEIDARLADRYLLPFSPVPSLIKFVCADIAQYLATLAYRQSADLKDKDPVVLRHLRALAVLEALATGTLTLPPGTPVPPDSAGGVGGVDTPWNLLEYQLFRPDDFDIGVFPRPDWRP